MEENAPGGINRHDSLLFYYFREPASHLRTWRYGRQPQGDTLSCSKVSLEEQSVFSVVLSLLADTKPNVAVILMRLLSDD